MISFQAEQINEYFKAFFFVFRNRSVKRHLETRQYMRGNLKLFLLTFLFIFQFISLLHEYLFCSLPTPSPITFLIVHLTLWAVPPKLLSDAKWSSGEPMNSSADPKEGPGPQARATHYFLTKPRPEGLKIFLGETAPPPPAKNLDDLDPPLSQGLDSQCYLPPKLFQYVAYAVTLRSHGRAEAGGT